ncbi:helix-turn-helix domain-containing protein [Clostridium saccharobutylicum]|uniref:Helix-turn-helix domain protein n=1 Tax=Clostridium saccharobutylicum TaxID=169679 RepID=A0A1S8N3W3_CLOSA|nr:helix-turn-helix domain-containing protein [Clostridium saccharobutylicum]OOM11154.1 helix-turn-helix domain protein [Clostridium saccharobutylicum]
MGNRITDNKTMSVKEFCNEYGVGINKGYEIINSIDFPMLRLGRRILIIRSKVDEWMENQIGKRF